MMDSGKADPISGIEAGFEAASTIPQKCASSWNPSNECPTDNVMQPDPSRHSLFHRFLKQ
jgi:hypothetical protein